MTTSFSNIATAVAQTVDIGMSVPRENSHSAFLEEGGEVIPFSYSTAFSNADVLCSFRADSMQPLEYALCSTGRCVRFVLRFRCSTSGSCRVLFLAVSDRAGFLSISKAVTLAESAASALQSAFTRSNVKSLRFCDFSYIFSISPKFSGFGFFGIYKF